VTDGAPVGGSRRMRLWVGASALLVAAVVVATIAIGRPRSWPSECWYCAATGSIASSRGGERVDDLHVLQFQHGDGRRSVLVFRQMSILEEIRTRISGYSFDMEGQSLCGTGGFEERDGRRWERCTIEESDDDGARAPEQEPSGPPPSPR
jgi:hypothetical protein